MQDARLVITLDGRRGREASMRAGILILNADDWGLVAHWTIDHMQSQTGFFYYRKYSFLTVRTPYFHWGQGTMFKALAHFALRHHLSSR